MAHLIAIDASGQDFVDAMQRAWDAGDAVLPVDPRLPTPAARAMTDALGAGDAVSDEVALVMPTSGTSGTPKGVELTHENLLASSRATSARLGVVPERDRWLACLPLAHVGGLSVVTRALHTSTPLTVHPTFDAADVNAAAIGGCTHVSLVPTALQRVRHQEWLCIVLGGSSPPPNPPSNSVTTYGLTETTSGVVYDGAPLDGVEIRVVHEEIQLRGPMIAQSYRDGSPVVDDAGWLHTGDLGQLTSGTLEVFGRMGDLIITGGENLHPQPVEDLLRTHASIGDVAVIGRPDPTWGQRVVAVVELVGPEPALDELRSLVQANLPAWAAPKAIEIVDELPRTGLGKLRRAALRGEVT